MVRLLNALRPGREGLTKEDVTLIVEVGLEMTAVGTSNRGSAVPQVQPLLGRPEVVETIVNAAMIITLLEMVGLDLLLHGRVALVVQVVIETMVMVYHLQAMALLRHRLQVVLRLGSSPPLLQAANKAIVVMADILAPGTTVRHPHFPHRRTWVPRLALAVPLVVVWALLLAWGHYSRILVLLRHPEMHHRRLLGLLRRHLR
jgi:hypothetical protein